MTEARTGHTAALLRDGRVLVVGGHDHEATTSTDAAPRELASAELYDPTSGHWTRTASTSVTRYAHTATLLPDGKVLVAGGLDFEAAHLAGVEIMGRTSAEVYDPGTGRWSTTDSMCTGRGAHTATLLADGRVLVTGGGYAGDAEARSAELYDPSTGTWTATGSMSEGRFDHTATLLADGRVLVASGRSLGSDPVALSTAELYDPSTGRWTTTEDLGPRACLLSRLADDRVLAVKASDDDQPATATLFDPATGRWTVTGSLTDAGSACSAMLLDDGRVFVVKGSNDGAPATAEAYDPTSGTWTAAESLVTARAGATATLLADGRVLVAGGDLNAALSSAELYDPRT